MKKNTSNIKAYYTSMTETVVEILIRFVEMCNNHVTILHKYSVTKSVK